MENPIFYWIYNKNVVWEKGILIEKKNDHVVVKTNDNMFSFENKNVLLCSNKNNCENLVDLIYLNEAEILHMLNERYTHNQIYTLNDTILLSINPFKNIDIYNDTYIYDYNKEKKKSPHVYLTTQNAFDNLMKTNKNQTILVSGESGAGKTQTTKYIMRYLSSISKNTINTKIDSKILASNPILEAFGNAKTIRNHNSSRFGKFIKLLFNHKYDLMGAKIDTYLLEKIRVTNTNMNEQNFHIFYTLINGMTEKDKKIYYLETVDTYHYLNNSEIEEPYLEIKYNELINSFNILQFNKTHIHVIFSILSFILHLGNIQSLKDIDNINICVKLLNIDKKQFIDLLENRYINVGTEKIEIKNTEKEFKLIRDTFAQTLYAILFNYIVDKINKNIENTYDYFIGILDIFGFEVFENNGFEQLCINYTNEKLQYILNQYIFELEQKEYIKENIEWEHITYPNNIDVLKLIQNKNGLFSLLEEQCLLKSGNDTELFNSIFKLSKNKNEIIFIENLDKIEQKINIRHYAGDVKYKIIDFVEKNKNNGDTRIIELLNDENCILKNINTTLNNNNKKKTIIKQFIIQLKKLLDTIHMTEQHYIRCIKPNNENIADSFSRSKVYTQLCYCGVLEMVKFANAGYPIKILKDDFIDEFYSMFLKNNIKLNNDNISTFIEIYFKQDKSLYQIGKHKIFLKRGLYEEFMYRNNELVEKNSTIIQTYIRKWIYKRRFQLYRLSIIKLQQIWKKYLIIKKKSINIIQHILYGYFVRTNYLKTYCKIKKIQKCIKIYLHYKKNIRISSSIKIQCFIRNKIAVQIYNKKKKLYDSVLKIQKQYKIYKNRKVIGTKLNELISFHGSYQLKINTLENCIVEKNILIQNLLCENNKLKEKINQTYNTNIDEDFNNDIATKMENLYLKLSIAETQIKQIKYKDDSDKQGFINILKSYFK